MLQYAYVVFDGSPRRYYVVEISDIENFKPKAACDFSTANSYMVKWERSGNGVLPDFHPATIKCLSSKF